MKREKIARLRVRIDASRRRLGGQVEELRLISLKVVRMSKVMLSVRTRVSRVWAWTSGGEVGIWWMVVV